MTGYGKCVATSKKGDCQQVMRRGDRRVSRRAMEECYRLNWRSACCAASSLLIIAFKPGEDLLEIRPGVPMIGGGFQDVLILGDGFPVFAGLGQAIR